MEVVHVSHDFKHYGVSKIMACIYIYIYIYIYIIYIYIIYIYIYNTCVYICV